MANHGRTTRKTMANTGSYKRRRKSPDSLHIIDLTDNIFANVAAFLPKPSRALFAVAMTAPSSSWAKFNWRRQPSAMSKAIISPSLEQWEALDFSDIKENLAKKLSDDDVGGILACINAANNLKSLKLTGCVNITGRGLEPLRHSTVMEDIDLSLVKQHESPSIEPEPLISEPTVLPILDSIVDADGNSFEFILLPKMWRRRQSSVMDRFLGNFNRLLETRRHRCSECKRLCHETSLSHNEGIIRDHGNFFGLQNFSCCICRKYFCCECEQGGRDILKFCGKCERDYCIDCIPIKGCDKCDKDVCSGCATIEECGICEDMFCYQCGPPCPCRTDVISCRDCVASYYRCEQEGCNRAHCTDCYDGEDEDYTVEYCGDCKQSFCCDCRFMRCNKDEWMSNCSGCLKLISKIIPELAKENERLSGRTV